MTVYVVSYTAEVSVCQLTCGRKSYDTSQEIAALHLRNRRKTVRRTAWHGV
jgi:hypothetical protein